MHAVVVVVVVVVVVALLAAFWARRRPKPQIRSLTDLVGEGDGDGDEDEVDEDLLDGLDDQYKMDFDTARDAYLRVKEEEADGNGVRVRGELVRRAMSVVEKYVVLKRDYPKVSLAHRKQFLSPEAFHHFLEAKARAEHELDEITHEAESLKEGWGAGVIEQACQFLHHNKRKEAIREHRERAEREREVKEREEAKEREVREREEAKERKRQAGIAKHEALRAEQRAEKIAAQLIQEEIREKEKKRGKRKAR